LSQWWWFGLLQLVAVVLGFFYYELVLGPANDTLHHYGISSYKYFLPAFFLSHALLMELQLCVEEQHDSAEVTCITSSVQQQERRIEIGPVP
jgi:hypothetical protein